MKVLLIYPPFESIRNIYTGGMFPIGLSYLASALALEGHQVKILDLNIIKRKRLEIGTKYTTYLDTDELFKRNLEKPDHPVWENLKQVLYSGKYDCVGIHFKQNLALSGIITAKIAKHVLPKCLTVAGGPYVVYNANKILSSGYVDFVLKGEAEETLPALLKSKSDNERYTIPGIAFINQSGKYFEDSSVTQIKNIDTIPFPKRDMLFDWQILNRNRLGAVITSRGCPYECAFCDAPSIWGRKVRFKSLPLVIEELEYLTKNITRSISFWDDSFTLNKSRIIEFCQEIIRAKLNFVWSCTTRADHIDEEILFHMKRAGCYAIDLGIESGSPRILEIINKQIPLDLVRKTIRMIRSYGILANGFFMIGFPDETISDIEATISFMKENELSTICLSIYTPYPGTPLHDRAKKLGLITDNIEWGLISHQSKENYFVKDITKEEFSALRKKAFSIAEQVNKKQKLNNLITFFKANPREAFTHLKERIFVK